MTMNPSANGSLPLLVASGRTQMDEGAVQQLREAAGDVVYWQPVIRDAQLHGVLPLLARNVLRYGHDLVPANDLQDLRNRYLAQSARNTLIHRTLLDASEHLYQAGILAIAIKGPTLARRAYGDLSLRQFSDLDFLIRRADNDAIIATLGAAGYQHLRTGQNWQYLKFQSSDGFLLDLQWGLGPEWFRFPLDFEAVWDRAEYSKLDGEQVLELPDSDTLMLLCGHASKHCWSKLGWLLDLNEYLLRRGRLVDWDALSREAESLGGLRILLLGIALVSDIFGGEIPPGMEKRVRDDRGLNRLARTVRAKLATSGKSLASSEGGFSRSEIVRFHLAARERLRDRLPYAKHELARRLDWKPAVERVIRLGKRLRGSAIT